MNGFEINAYWGFLKPNSSAVEERTNSTFTAPRSPTIQEANCAYVPVKYDFQHIFYRGDFEVRVDMV